MDDSSSSIGNACPFCGETKTDWDYIRMGVFNKGILAGTPYKEFEGFEREFTCLTCGKKWRIKWLEEDLYGRDEVQGFKPCPKADRDQKNVRCGVQGQARI